MITKDIPYTAAGRSLTGFLADGSDGTPSPGIIVCHQGGGLSHHERERARMLAELGYVAFALDMYGEAPTTRDHAMQLLSALVGNPKLWDEIMLAGLDQLKTQSHVDASRLGAIGFCFGGMTVLEMVRATDALQCVVAFHPGLNALPQSDPRKLTGKVMVCAGLLDPLIPPSGRELFLKLMQEAGADCQYITYANAGHSFTDKSVDALNLANFRYEPSADRRSWAAMCDLFNETF